MTTKPKTQARVAGRKSKAAPKSVKLSRVDLRAQVKRLGADSLLPPRKTATRAAARKTQTPKNIIFRYPSDPVHEQEKGRWYFWDETWASRHGPYDTQTSARKELKAYAAMLHNKKPVPHYADLNSLLPGEPYFLLKGRDPVGEMFNMSWCLFRRYQIQMDLIPDTPEERAQIADGFRNATEMQIFARDYAVKREHALTKFDQDGNAVERAGVKIPRGKKGS